MNISSRVNEISESVTLKLNAKAVELADNGKKIYNLTAGQLPFRPLPEFVESIKGELNFLKSFQYSPVAGFVDLRKKIMNYFEKSRVVSLTESGVEFDCVLSNGGKHSLSNVFASIIDPGDEVIMLSPHWVSYPQMVRFYGGVPIVVTSNIYNVFRPSIEEISKALSSRTKAIVINSPNNPSGVHYTKEWMEEFAELMLAHPDVSIVCDEIYFELYYFDPKPTYFYQYKPELLKQTIIVDGISKTLAATGLRLGWTIAPKALVRAMTKIQGQTASGANSLVQRGLIEFDFDKVEEYLQPIKDHLRKNSQIVREKFREANLAHGWYQSVSAFYYMVDFSQTPMFEKKYKVESGPQGDFSTEICEIALSEYGIAIVPGTDFGNPNSARISLVLDAEAFSEAITLLCKFLTA